MLPDALIRPGMSAALVLAAALLAASAAFIGLQVNDAGAQAMQLQVTVSSPDSDLNDGLCSAVREALIDFLQRVYPGCLPRLRIELEAGVHNGAR